MSLPLAEKCDVVSSGGRPPSPMPPPHTQFITCGQKQVPMCNLLKYDPPRAMVILLETSNLYLGKLPPNMEIPYIAPKGIVDA